MAADRAFAEGVRGGLAEVADPVRAEGMRAYLKSELPCLGVPLPVVRRVVAGVLETHPMTTRDVWAGTVATLFDGATYREERHAALALAGHRVARGWQDPEALDLYRHLIVTGAWWDLVDETAHRVGDVLRRHRVETTAVLDAWSHDPDRWLRRVAVIAQVGHQGDTDRDLLARAIEATVDDRDFFIRKAIGWALRDLARTDPGWVRGFVGSHGALSPLSRREALKHLGGAP